MRYFISILVVSALAVQPATSQEDCPSVPRLKAAWDWNLPVAGLMCFAPDCDSLSWMFDFTRTMENGEGTIFPNIVGTDMYEEVRSSEWSAGTHQIEAIAYVTGPYIQLRIDIAPGSDCWLFHKMVLEAEFFNDR